MEKRLTLELRGRLAHKVSPAARAPRVPSPEQAPAKSQQRTREVMVLIRELCDMESPFSVDLVISDML